MEISLLQVYVLYLSIIVHVGLALMVFWLLQLQMNPFGVHHPHLIVIVNLNPVYKLIILHVIHYGVVWHVFEIRIRSDNVRYITPAYSDLNFYRHLANQILLFWSYRHHLMPNKSKCKKYNKLIETQIVHYPNLYKTFFK